MHAKAAIWPQLKPCFALSGMNAVARKILLAVALFLALNQIPRLFLTPFYGNQIYTAKYEKFSSAPGTYNTVVMGSMKLYRQIDPVLLDESLAAFSTSTFNLAAPTTDHPEVFYLYEQLLEENDRFGIRTALIELQPLNYILENNVTSPRNYYWHNFSDLTYAIAYMRDAQRPFGEKADYIYKYVMSYIVKTTNLYGYKALRLPEKRGSVGREGNGFYALDDEMVDVGGENFFTNRLATFLEDGEAHIERRKTQLTPQFNRDDYADFVNQTFLKKLNALIAASDAKGVKLVFIIPPRGEEYLELLAIKNELPADHIIELANPGTVPELYTVAGSFDTNHLNKAGAAIFTSHVAKALREILGTPQ